MYLVTVTVRLRSPLRVNIFGCVGIEVWEGVLLCMGGDHCHNSTRARFSYSGRAISYSGRAVSYSGRAISYSGRAVLYLGGAISYLGGAISLQLRNSTLGKNVLLQLRYRHDTS